MLKLSFTVNVHFYWRYSLWTKVSFEIYVNQSADKYNN